jgi:hypothetical protein
MNFEQGENFKKPGSCFREPGLAEIYPGSLRKNTLQE